nr:MAG TPA: hypothetical protein [Caudoviricetes sp.]
MPTSAFDVFQFTRHSATKEKTFAGDYSATERTHEQTF